MLHTLNTYILSVSLYLFRSLYLALFAIQEKSCYSIPFCRCLKSIPIVTSSFFCGTSYSTQLFMKLPGLLAVHVNTSYRLSPCRLSPTHLHYAHPYSYSYSYLYSNSYSHSHSDSHSLSHSDAECPLDVESWLGEGRGTTWNLPDILKRRGEPGMKGR